MEACAQRVAEEEVTQTTTVTEVPEQVCERAYEFLRFKRLNNLTVLCRLFFVITASGTSFTQA